MKCDLLHYVSNDRIGNIATHAFAIWDDPVTQTSSSLQNANIA